MTAAAAAKAATSSGPSSLVVVCLARLFFLSSRFGRVALLGVGFMVGSIKASNAQSAREAALRATIQERTEKLAAIEAANAPPVVVAEGKPSSGDPVQDWIDSLE